MLDGFTSRWTTPWSWQCCSASATSATSSTDRCSGRPGTEPVGRLESDGKIVELDEREPSRRMPTSHRADPCVEFVDGVGGARHEGHDGRVGGDRPVELRLRIALDHVAGTIRGDDRRGQEGGSVMAAARDDRELGGIAERAGGHELVDDLGWICDGLAPPALIRREVVAAIASEPGGDRPAHGHDVVAGAGVPADEQQLFAVHQPGGIGGHDGHGPLARFGRRPLESGDEPA